MQMKHESLMDRTDKAEFAKAWRLIKDGRKLRGRVLSRLRMRAIRAAAKQARGDV